MNEASYPELVRTELLLRALGYGERSIREITAASRREIVRCAVLRRFFDENGARRNHGGGGGVSRML